MKCIRHHLLDVGIALIAVAMGASLVAGEASAQTTTLAFSAKFVCGIRTTDLGVVRGTYETTVNVHNPHFVTVQFQKKAVIALPERSARGKISAIRVESLKPDEAMGVDCADIRRLFNPAAAGFIEGFLVIYVTRQMDVVGVYTARERNGTSADAAIYDASSIAVERVTPIPVQTPPG